MASNGSRAQEIGRLMEHLNGKCSGGRKKPALSGKLMRRDGKDIGEQMMQ